MTTNDITGARLVSKVATPEYRSNFERIFNSRKLGEPLELRHNSPAPTEDAGTIRPASPECTQGGTTTTDSGATR